MFFGHPCTLEKLVKVASPWTRLHNLHAGRHGRQVVAPQGFCLMILMGHDSP